MIKILSLAVTGPHRLMLAFSDGSRGEWDGWPLFSTRVTVLTEPLLEPHEFARAFIENGALAWPNGLEFAPWSLHEELRAAGKLERLAA
jgi:Protein of unknown function (DUF2442)